MELKPTHAPDPRVWRNMFSDLLDTLKAGGVDEWLEISDIDTAEELRVKQINLLGLIRQRKLLGEGYRVKTMRKYNREADTWTLYVCKVVAPPEKKSKKKGKRK